MLSVREKLVVAIKGSFDVSNPINIQNAGLWDQFTLTKENERYEYSYSTEVYLATPDDYIYTKITTISPLYVIVNKTKGILVVSQEGCQSMEFGTQSINIDQRIPFHWLNKDKPSKIQIKLAQ